MADLVVKSNKLVQALQTLSLTEVRLLQLAIVDARETSTGLSSSKPLVLYANRYAETFNVTLDAAYLALIEAEESLFKKKFIIKNDDGSTTKSRWIQDATYQTGQGKILITLTRVVIEHVTRIDGFEKYFTSYRLERTASFKSVYAVRLYELLIQWKSTQKTPTFPIEKFRSQLGVGVNEYERVEAFKRRVLDVALEQINQYSDIQVKCEQHKNGRSISGFSFIFAFKQKEETQPKKAKEKTIKAKDENTIDLFSEMTEKQLNFFSSKLSELAEMQAMAEPGEEMPDFIKRIKGMLQDPVKQKKLQPYLKQVGFSSH